jgi:phosphate-selective porin OprO/OprP
LSVSIRRLRRFWLAAFVSISSAGAAAQSTTPAPGVQAQPESAWTFDRVWKFADWYSDEDNQVVQRVLFSGRYQHEFATLRADQGDHSEWNVRRMRLGPRITLFRKMTFHTEAELNPQETDPFFVRMTDLYVQWTFNPRAVLTIGKQGVPFTMDGSTSSKELVAIDRSNLTNNIWFTYEYIPGVSVSGRIAPWTYRAGVYSSGTANRGLGEFDGGVFVLGLVGYDFGKKLGVKEAVLAGNYIYQRPDPRNTFTRPFENIGSVNFKLEDETWGFRADVSAAAGYLGQRDVWGLMAMPLLNLTDKLQLVGRYTMLRSDGPGGVRLAAYENTIVSGRGDRYHELYGGVNYYFYEHKLKLQSGVQFADLNNRDADTYSGTSWTTGIRIGW